MIKLTFSRPNTIGTYYENTFDEYPLAKINRTCEVLEQQGWDCTYIAGSTSESGAIECIHDNFADIKLIQWETVASENESDLECPCYECVDQDAVENQTA